MPLKETDPPLSIPADFLPLSQVTVTRRPSKPSSFIRRVPERARGGAGVEDAAGRVGASGGTK